MISDKKSSTAITAFAGHFSKGPTGKPVQITSLEEFKSTFGDLNQTSETWFGVYEFFQNGGTEAWVLQVHHTEENLSKTESASAFSGNLEEKTGINALYEIPEFHILCIPELAIFDTEEALPIIRKAQEICREKLAIFIIDYPLSITDSAEITRWVNENEIVKDPNCILYFPTLEMTIPESKSMRRITNSGIIAGLFEQTDQKRGFWNAPGGTHTQIQSIHHLTTKLTNQETIDLNNMGINCIRHFKSQGNIVWGSGTLVGMGHDKVYWKYIGIRRLVLNIEENIRKVTEFAQQEPNIKPTWYKIRNACRKYMSELFKLGIFPGIGPEDAYYIKCDAETTTKQDIENGIVTIHIGIAMFEPAQYEVIQISRKIQTP